MSREILFRGKRVDGNWAYGSFFQTNANGHYYHIIFTPQESRVVELERKDLAIAFFKDETNVVYPETLGQFTGLLDKNGAKIFEGDEVRYRMPFRTTQTHTGDNIPNGSYTEPMEPGIKEVSGIVEYKSGMFTIEDYEDLHAPISWIDQIWDLESIKDAISWTRQTDGWFDDPEEGDLQYLIKEVAKVENEEELIKYLSGIEIIGNIHDTPNPTSNV